MSYFIFQGNDHDCGFTSLKILLALLSKDKNYLYLKKDNDKRKGYNFFELAEIAEKHNLRLESYQVDFVEFLKVKTPFLAQLRGNHSVVVKSISKRSILIFDPAEGKRRIRIKEFEKMFGGYILEPSDYTGVSKCQDSKMRILPLYRRVSQYVLAVLMGAAFMAGFYFLNDESNFILLIAFLVVIALAELVENWYLIKNIKYFDSTYMSKYFESEENHNLEQYNRYLEFKKTYFGSSRSLVASILLILLISTLLVLNDYKNLMFIVLILIVRVVDKVIFDKKETKTINTISELEKNAFDKNNPFNDLLTASEHANGFALSLSARKCINAFIVAIFAILMMMFNKLVSPNYVLFYFGAYYIISNSCGGLVNYLSDFKKLKKDEARFFDSCNL